MRDDLAHAVASTLDCLRRVIRAAESGEADYLREAKEKLAAADRSLMRDAERRAAERGR